MIKKQQLVQKVSEMIGKTVENCQTYIDEDVQINTVAAKIVEFLQTELEPEPDPSQSRPLSELVGEVIELTIHFSGGSVTICGRVTHIPGSSASGGPFYAVGDAANLPLDAVVRPGCVGRGWVFESAHHIIQKARLNVNSPESIEAAQAAVIKQVCGAPLPDDAVVSRIHDATIVDPSLIDPAPGLRLGDETIVVPSTEYENVPNARPMTIEKEQQEIYEAMEGRR